MSRTGPDRRFSKPYEAYSALGSGGDNAREWTASEHLGLHLHSTAKAIDDAIDRMGKLIRHATASQPMDEFIELRETLNKASMQVARILSTLAKEEEEIEE